MGFVEVTDARDGLYPSLRQALAILRDTLPENRFIKSSAAIQTVSDTIGEDVDSIYYTLVDAEHSRCALPLISGHGNFGFPPAYREYSEMKLSSFFTELIDEYQIEDFNCPLPMPIPYALVCGTVGYCKGVTKIPTHNLEEVMDAEIALVKNPDMDTRELLHFIKGPDLLIGGEIENPQDLPRIYESGHGFIKVIVNQQNINKYSICNVRDYSHWYGIKSRKLWLQKNVRITISYHALMNNGTECRLMSLKEIIKESLSNFRKFHPQFSDAELISTLSGYKKLSPIRITKAEN